MNRKNIESDIVTAYTYKNGAEIQNIYIELVNTRAKLDRWFTKYIDMFDEKMNGVTREHPIWKLYHAKSNEYSDVSQTIKTAEYYMKKVEYV